MNELMNQLVRFPLWKNLAIFSYTNFATHDDPYVEAGGTADRAKFLEEARLDPPRILRVIDCELSVRVQAVVIIDCPNDVQASGSSGGYTAISHTYGQDVYDAFNCVCAADCRAHVARADPSKSSCQHDDPVLQQRVIGDVLGMCRLLVDAGVRYAWHDGVCIAQHDEEEVNHFIQHIAWIYANADETIIFLHNIARPMAPIAPLSYPYGLISRWQTRVWTFQEAAISKCRRYCVRVGCSLKDCIDFDDFEQKLATWYEPKGNNITRIIDESEFLDMLEQMQVVGRLRTHSHNNDSTKLLMEWVRCLYTWKILLMSLRSSFPTIAHALDSCSSRESKHDGDRINSILGIAKVKGFSAHKDNNVEESTMEFFKRMGKPGLVIALFTANRFNVEAWGERPHTWYPTLRSHLHFTPSHFRPSGPNFYTDHVDFALRCEDDSLEVGGLLACVSLVITLVTDKKELREEVCNAPAALLTTLSLSAFADRNDYWLGVPRLGNCLVWVAIGCRRTVLLGTALPTIIAEEFTTRELSLPPYLLKPISTQYSFKINLIFPAEILVGFPSPDNYDVDNSDFVLEKEKWPVTTDEIMQMFTIKERNLWEASRSFAAVMVEGNISISGSEAVCVGKKVGCFIGSPVLRQVVLMNEECLTFLSKLRIQ